MGIAWVVECVEQRQRVNEERFNIDLEGVNLAGINKVRSSAYRWVCTSLTINPSDDARYSQRPSLQAMNRVKSVRQLGIRRRQMSHPVSLTPPSLCSTFYRLPASVVTSVDDLPPLEKARLRKGILPSGR